MSKTYCFVFPGTREQFLKTLNQYPNNDRRFFYFNDYIVEVSDENIHFGVQRGGHSGGYWFKPTIEEIGDKLQFRGKLAYIENHTNDGRYQKFANKLYEACLFVILLPIFLGLKLYVFIKKITKRPIEKEETPEDRLFYLMEDLLNCAHKDEIPI